MAEPRSHASPTTELIARLMRVVRTCPEATADVLELVLLVSQIEAIPVIDRDYRDARRGIARLRHPLGVEEGEEAEVGDVDAGPEVPRCIAAHPEPGRAGAAQVLLLTDQPGTCDQLGAQIVETGQGQVGHLG